MTLEEIELLQKQNIWEPPERETVRSIIERILQCVELHSGVVLKWVPAQVAAAVSVAWISRINYGVFSIMMEQRNLRSMEQVANGDIEGSPVSAEEIHSWMLIQVDRELGIMYRDTIENAIEGAKSQLEGGVPVEAKNGSNK